MAYDYDLGSYSFPVTTKSPDAQTWFDRGYMWSIGFNHDEAVACFRRAAEADPGMAMAHWGIAYASGPNYNKAWEVFDEADLRRTLAASREAFVEAWSRIHDASEMEQALIEALGERCRAPAPPDADDAVAELDGWTDAYAIAMRRVRARFPDNDDVAMLTAEAMMNRTNWELWDLKTGSIAAGADTAEAADILETAMAHRERVHAPPHPGLLHMYIHLMEMSPHPQKALKAADQLRGLAPDCGHLQHMPTHIDILCGHYQSAVDWNDAGIVADRKYLEHAGAENFYTFYRCHNYHFKAYAAMFLGQHQPAMEAARELNETLPEALLRVTSPPMADWMEGFVPTEQHIMIRFGRWEEIIARPLPSDQDLYAYTTATTHYAKAVAYAAREDVVDAEREAERFQAARERMPSSRTLLNNSCADILSVANEMMLGEIAYRKGAFDEAFRHLRRSVELDDNLPYDEPWGWMQPTRHALGALLLEQDEVDRALAVYRADLGLDPTLSRACQHPDNVWSLTGYHECLIRLDRHDEAELVKQRLDLANARCDRPVVSSCFCRLGR